MVEDVEHDRNADPLGEQQDLSRAVRSSFSTTSRERAPSLSRANPVSNRSTDPTWTTILCEDRAPNELEQPFWYSSSATAAPRPPASLDERTVYWPGWVERRAPTAERGRRSGRSARRTPRTTRGPFTGCEPNGIRSEVTRNTSMPCCSFQRRIASSAPRLRVDQFAQTLGRRVRQADRARRRRQPGVDARVPKAKAPVVDGGLRESEPSRARLVARVGSARG